MNCAAEIDGGWADRPKTQAHFFAAHAGRRFEMIAIALYRLGLLFTNLLEIELNPARCPVVVGALLGARRGAARELQAATPR